MMARLRSSLLLAASLCFLVGCGDDNEESQPQTQPGQVNEQSAKAAARGTVQASLTAVQDQNGQGAASQLHSVASTTQGIVTPAAPSGPGTTAQARILEAFGPGLGTLDGENCECTETGCTFLDCDWGGSTNTMAGTISWEGGHLKCDLTFKTAGSAFSGDIEMTTSCDLKVTETSIDGTLGTTGKVASITGADGTAFGSYEWATTTHFDKVTYDTSKQPTSGSVHVEGTYTIMGQVYSGSADVTFP